MKKFPASKDIQKVIENFEKVLPSAMNKRGHFCMWEGEVDKEQAENAHNSNHICKTTTCHGGWYAIAVWDKLKDKKDVDYVNGANLMARDLGFTGVSRLSDWAESNPEIWGNDHGDEMFNEPRAFRGKGRPKGAKTLQDVVNHWKEVRDRVKELENSKK